MIEFAEAQRLLREYVKPGRIVNVPLLDSLGLALARPLPARADSPRFDASAVDGYAVSLSDFADGLPVSLSVSNTTHAGATSLKQLKPGSTVRIFTGAPVPKGADAIVMQEDVTTAEPPPFQGGADDRSSGGWSVTIQQAPERGAYIRKRGGELRRGERIFESGTVVTPSVAQTLTACGYARVPVHERPSVSVIVTGNELRTPGSKLKAGEIWDSNTTALQSALCAIGAENIHVKHVADHPRATTQAISAALERSDVVIATGGVSVGDRDYVKEAFAANGVREIFWRVSIRPGMPIYFGIKRQSGKTKYVFGLPGNPVSVMVTFQLFVRLALLRMMGHVEENKSTRGVLSMPLKKSISRTEFVRARPDSGSDGFSKVTPFSARESHMTTSMAKADCLIVFPADRELLEAGNEVEIIPILWTPY